MYEFKKTAFGKRTCLTIHNPLNGNEFSVVPDRGATVLAIRFGGVDILDGYRTPEELEVAKWGKSALLFPFPNRLDGGQYEWLGKTYRFPINNAATGNAIHGFVRDEVFETEYVFTGKEAASVLCSYTYLGNKPFYPFAFVLKVKYIIDNANTFRLESSCQNLHHEPIPLGFGWHPYFRLADHAGEHRMQLPACEKITVDERMIPTGERSEFPDFQRNKSVGDSFLDNCFLNKKTTGAYKMSLEGNGRRIAVKANARHFPFFQVFTPPHRESIALEPMTCNVNAFNNREGLVTLAPNETWKAKIEINLVFGN